MKQFIKQRLHEAIKNIPYDERPEMKQHSYSSLSDPNRKTDVNTIKYRIAKAAQIASEFNSKNPDNHYFNSPTSGDGFYQVEIRHDGQIKTKHIKASGDMEQRNGAFQPSDIGTCKNYQNVAKYCFVKAGINNSAVGASPAADAADKVMIIFRDEIIDFFNDGGYDDGKASDISKNNMSDKQARHKEKKDLETKLNRRISDTEWNTYLQTGKEPQPKSIGLDPKQASDVEQRQAAIQAKINALKARRK